MYFLIAGMSVKQFISAIYSELIGILLFVVSSIIFLLGILNYRIQRKKIIESEIHIGDFKTEYLEAK
jgi:putative membrane protein